MTVVRMSDGGLFVHSPVALDPALQSDLVRGLQDAEVAELFAAMDPDDRVWLLDELPASVAPRLLRGLPARERQLTANVLNVASRSLSDQ
ncbi:MAG TPA: hypothetical protein PKA88_13980, partial [Polyangiaceae bacterium]|nr:hypothetical protein [Polyangiaceae bacterium]